MFRNILRSVLDNVRRFLIVWLLVLLANQILIFGACFAPYCIAAAVPHTFVIAALINFMGFYGHDKPKKSLVSPARSSEPASKKSDGQTSRMALLALVAIGIVLAVVLSTYRKPAPEPLAEHRPALSVAPEPASSESQIRDCVAQGIRLEGIRELAVLDTPEKRTRYNTLIADYALRCATQMSPSPALDAAVEAIEPYRRALKLEGMRSMDARPAG